MRCLTYHCHCSCVLFATQTIQVAAGLGVTALIGNAFVAGFNKVNSIANEEEESLYGAKIQVDATEVRNHSHAYMC
jgi:hypothetical protein